MKNFLQLHPDYKNRVYGLDIMRAIAILAVVAGHGGYILNITESNFPWIPLIDGVELFFVLSGFLIGSILLKLFNAPDFQFSSLLNFFKRRWLRTLPNYYLILIINIVIVYFGIINEDFSQFNFGFFLFLQNFCSHFTGFFWESWSLSVEEWFYVLFPFLLLLLFVLFQKSFARKNIFLAATVLLLIIPFLLRLNKSLNTEVDGFWLGPKILKVVIYRLDSIAFGILAAFIKYYHHQSFYRYKTILLISGFVLLYARMFFKHEPNSLYMKTFDVTLISIGCTLLLPFFDSIKQGKTRFSKIITHISLISYSMYLINLCIVAEIIRDHFAPETKMQGWITYGLFWFAVIFLSTIQYKFYEKPIMDLRKNLKSNADF